MSEIILKSPAKLNLFLHILGRRADGYHNLQMVLQLIDYCDELKFILRNDNEINLLGERRSPLQELMGPTEKNLIVRAAKLLQKEFNISQGADISLYKKIPIGGGLGGGSTNAATTLIALNKLWQLNLSLDELASLGLQLGADVPVFIRGKTAWAEGIGEILTPITLEEKWFVVIVPPSAVPTAEIYSATELTRNTPPITIRAFLEGCETHNDCEAVVRTRYPLVANALDWLNQFAPARLTGTGACVFAALKNQEEAQRIAQQIPQPLQGFVARGINNSPLLN